jgi:serine protease Do
VDSLEQGSPAARAGLERGDTLLAAGDTSIASSLDLERALFDRPAGEHVTLRYRHGGVEKSIEVALETGRGAGIEQAANAPGDLVWQKIGLHVQAVGADSVNRSYPQFRGGLSVTEVRPDSPAERAGMQRGDILVGLHKFEMLSADHVHFVLNQPDAARASALKFYYLRGSQLKSGQFQVGD